jgi:hypothetical protein
MRLWTLHPKYLDAQGLTALWREALLAQKVLQGQTKGYKHHPQLLRFKQHPDPLGAIAAYLNIVHEESVQRNYHFDKNKIIADLNALRIVCTDGQLSYELAHLKEKLKQRDKKKYEDIRMIRKAAANPIFSIIRGGAESWEVIRKT